MKIGPIQVIVFAFDSIDKFKGQIQHELDELRGHGLIRVIDLLLLMKEHDGTVHGIQSSDVFDAENIQLGTVLEQMLAERGADPAQADLSIFLDDLEASAEGLGVGLAEIQAVAAEIVPGTAVALLLVEHAWAIGLTSAIRSADGRMVAQGFLTQDALLVVGQELNAIVEAEVAIERADAIRGAAMLDALTTVVAAEEVQQAALAQAVATVVGVEAFRTTVAAEAVRALIVAGVLEEAAAPAALATLVHAELITDAALDEAVHAAELAAAELAQEW